MSVLIKGMEMPTDGELLCINIYPDGKVSINLDLNCKQVATAVPVPPHGRLIDADALANKHRTMAYEDGGRKYSFGDRIRAMTDEDLAFLIASICYNREGKVERWKNRWLDWLKQEG